MRRAATCTKGLCSKCRVPLTALCIVIIPSRRQLYTRRRIIIQRAEFFTTAPTPGTTTSVTNNKSATRIETTGKYIVTGIILQTPAFTPWTLLCIPRHVVAYRYVFKLVQRCVVSGYY